MYSNGWAFLGDALVRPRQTFDRARNVGYWWPACGATAAVVFLGYMTDPPESLPIVVGVPLVTGLGLLVCLIVTAVARLVCIGYGAGLSATASQAALLVGAVNVPWSILEVAVGADAVLVAAAAGVSWVACIAYLTILFSAAFDVGNGTAFRGVVFGHLALLAPPVFFVSCTGLLSVGAGH
jgi:hypothetical protein